MFSNEMINNMLAIGGEEWRSRNGNDQRIYFRKKFILRAIDFRMGHYSTTGVFQYPTIKGKRISDHTARQLVAIASKVEFYYDLKTHTFEMYDKYRTANNFKWVFKEVIQYISDNITRA